MVDKKRSGRYLKFLIYLVVVILVNVAGITLFFRMDLTENSIYSIFQSQPEGGWHPVRTIDHQGLFHPEPSGAL